MSKRDEYIARNQGMADAYRAASLHVDNKASFRGANVREDLQAFCSAAKERAEWAEGLTNREFNAEDFKP